jgi:internalin A
MEENNFAPEVIIKTIEKASTEGSIELSFRGQGIEELPPEIGNATNLTSLDLSYNRLSKLPTELSNLKNLKHLNLSRNNFREFPDAILKLENLEFLYLANDNLKGMGINDDGRNVGLKSLPSNIDNLKKLAVLDLSANQIKDLPKGFENLQNLKSLSLSLNGITKLSDQICKLKNLELLTLGGNNIASLPKTFEQLSNLKCLLVGKNKFSIFPLEITRLKNLQILSIIGNSIKNIPPDIGELSNLRALILGFSSEFGENRIDALKYLNKYFFKTRKMEFLWVVDSDGSNRIENIPNEIGKLRKLNTLLISNNKLTSINPQIQGLKKLDLLDLRGNHIPIPPEILNKINKPQTILNFFFSTIAGQRNTINEIKLLIVGQGSVGKTSLVQQILHGTFDLHQTKTEGISINQWVVDSGLHTGESETLSTINGQSSIKLNTWDFGGQEIMHATHQFFLTKRSLYLLVLDARLTQEENRVEYWLKIIQSFGGDSPVLIVGNKTDQHPLDIDRTGLQKKYPNIVGFIETSATTGAGIEELKTKIAKQVDTLPHVHDLLPETWFIVKSKLEELAKNKNFFTQDEYLSLCDTNNVTDETSKHTLIGFLHDLGVVLHFQDDPRLVNLGILNPQWVTNGVYKILNSHKLFQNQGQLTVSILNDILDLPEYPSNKRLFIVDMMKKFELCYDIEPDKSFLIPDLLPKDEPFTGEWNSALAFQIHYNILPSSIISRFIVRMNAFVYKTVWRSGVVLKSSGNTALVKADIEDRKIYIWIAGEESTRRDFLSAIRMEFEAIHKTIAKIEATEKVPLPNAPEATPVDLTFLQQLASEGRESLPVQVGNKILDLIVKEILNRIETVNMGVMKGATIHIHGNQYGSIGDGNAVIITQNLFSHIYDAIENSSRKDAEKAKINAKVGEIEIEVAKGDQANETFLARRLRNLKKMAPEIAEVALAALTGPGTVVAAVVKNVAKRIKDETK